MKSTFIHEKYNLNLERPKNSIYISYSQYSQFQKCPQAWKLKYVDRHKIDKPSIHFIFGTAMHSVVQEYIQVMYTDTIKKADSLNFDEMLLNAIMTTYSDEAKRHKKHFSTKEELMQFYVDGLETLKYLRKKRTMFFDKKDWELIGIELPLIISPDKNRNSVVLLSYLDLVFRKKKDNKFLILDLKTSTRGWRDYEKKDQTKLDQLLLYKIYLSEQYNIPINSIEVEFYILKRKINEDSMYPERRIQTFKPSQGSITVKKAKESFQKFIDMAFLPDGSYNKETYYPAISGNLGSNCKFCDFRDRDDLCPFKDRIRKDV